MEFKESLDELALAVAEAFRSAREGRVAHGYLILLAGLEQARRSSAEGDRRLVELWHRVMTRFREQFPREWYLEVG